LPSRLRFRSVASARSGPADVLSNRVGVEHYAPNLLPTGTKVRVRNTLGSWAGGFEVVGVDSSGYRLRRVSDGAVLPTPIVATEVRKG